MARVNTDVLGISKLKWTEMGKFNSDDHYIYYCSTGNSTQYSVIWENESEKEPDVYTLCVCIQLLSHVQLFAIPWLLCPWNFPAKNIGVDCHFLLQGIFLTQGLNLYLLHCRQILYHCATGEALREVSRSVLNERIKPISSLIPKMLMFTLNHLLFDHFQFALIHGPNIPGSYAILLFTASDLGSIISDIHIWVVFSLWLGLFILSEVFLH